MICDKKKVSPIDVNMPSLNGMLLPWKPTGPEQQIAESIIIYWMYYLWLKKMFKLNKSAELILSSIF